MYIPTRMTMKNELIREIFGDEESLEEEQEEEEEEYMYEDGNEM